MDAVKTLHLTEFRLGQRKTTIIVAKEVHLATIPLATTILVILVKDQVGNFAFAHSRAHR